MCRAVLVVALLALFGLKVAAQWPAQPCAPIRERKAFIHLNCQERQQLFNAMKALKTNGIHDRFVKVHHENSGLSHSTRWFLPWHRWFLWIYENELRTVSGLCITLPYWDWENENGIEQTGRLLIPNFFGSKNDVSTVPNFGNCVTKGLAKWPEWDDAHGGCVTRAFNNYAFSTKAYIISMLTNNPDFSTFSSTIEGSPHSTPHVMIGGDMGTMISPADPLFMLHHCNVDRLWAMWQDLNGYDLVAESSITSMHYSGTGTFGPDVQMTYHLNQEPDPLFFMTGMNTPTARQVHLIADAPIMYRFAPDALINDFNSGGFNPSMSWFSSQTPAKFPEVACCGDGYRRVGTVPEEACDDGNNVAGDGCSATCTLEFATTTTVTLPPTTTTTTTMATTTTTTTPAPTTTTTTTTPAPTSTTTTTTPAPTTTTKAPATTTTTTKGPTPCLLKAIGQKCALGLECCSGLCRGKKCIVGRRRRELVDESLLAGNLTAADEQAGADWDEPVNQDPRFPNDKFYSSKGQWQRIKKLNPDLTFGQLAALVAKEECERLGLRGRLSASTKWMAMNSLPAKFYGYGC